jgi:thymidine kinase
MVTYFCGPMFSSKSTELLRQLERFSYAKKKILLIRPLKDSRDFFSHSQAVEDKFYNIEFTQLRVSSYEEYKESNLSEANFDVIAIDEAFMIKDCYLIIRENNGLEVFVSGLLASSECEIFPEVAKFLPYCDEIIKLNAVCFECGDLTANYTYYSGEDSKDSPIKVGGKESYQALCWHCYLRKSANKAYKANELKIERKK